jgi:hypothetical protein
MFNEACKSPLVSGPQSAYLAAQTRLSGKTK